MTINNLGIGRDVDETLRLIQAHQFLDKHGEVRDSRFLTLHGVVFHFRFRVRVRFPLFIFVLIFVFVSVLVFIFSLSCSRSHADVP